MKKLYVGNLPYKMTEQEVRSIFEEYGSVHTVTLIIDRYTGKMRGFGFVEMDNPEVAIKGLDGKMVSGRKIRVNIAREKKDASKRKFWQKK